MVKIRKDQVTEPWWEELGRHTLSGATDLLTLPSLTARKYLRIIVSTIASGQVVDGLRFNNDSGNNYSHTFSNNGGADTSVTSQNILSVASVAENFNTFCILEIVNITAQEKILTYHWGNMGAAGAANLPDRRMGFGKWANTAAQITRVDVINNGTGDFAAGSELVVLGHD